MSVHSSKSHETRVEKDECTYSSDYDQEIIQRHAPEPGLGVPEVQAQDDEAYADSELGPRFGDEALWSLHGGLTIDYCGTRGNTRAQE